MHTLRDLEGRYPWIAWREPVQISLIDSPQDKRYACRICIANDGIISEQIPTLPTDPADIRRHIAQLHEESPAFS